MMSDIDEFIKLRIEQLDSEGGHKNIDLTNSLRDYYNRHLTDGTFISYLALKEDNIIATSGVSIVEKPPYYGNPTGKIGIISSMFTKEQYRRKGIATKLMEKIVEHANSKGCGMIQITASKAGIPFYKKFGFKENNNYLQYRI